MACLEEGTVSGKPLTKKESIEQLIRLYEYNYNCACRDNDSIKIEYYSEQLKKQKEKLK